MIAITTKSSTSVNAGRDRFNVDVIDRSFPLAKLLRFP